jgi:hypothetical protein
VIPILIPTAVILFAAVGCTLAAFHTDQILADRREHLAVGYWLAVIHRTSDDPVLVRDPLTQPVLPRVDLRRDTHPGRPA